MFDILEADIVVMQEIKIQRKDLHDEMVLVPGWDVFFSLPKHKKGTLSPSRLSRSVANHIKGTLVSPSTHETPSVPRSGPKKESLVSLHPPSRRPSFAISLLASKSVATLGQASSTAS